MEFSDAFSFFRIPDGSRVLHSLDIFLLDERFSFFLQGMGSFFDGLPLIPPSPVPLLFFRRTMDVPTTGGLTGFPSLC